MGVPTQIKEGVEIYPWRRYRRRGYGIIRWVLELNQIDDQICSLFCVLYFDINQAIGRASRDSPSIVVMITLDTSNSLVGEMQLPSKSREFLDGRFQFN